MRKIKLYGEIGKLFGSEFNIEVNSPAEAVRALCVQIDGFEKYLLDSEKNGIGFKVLDNNIEATNQKELNIYGTGEIQIIPIITGSSGEVRVILGAALITAGAVFQQPYLLNAGVALAAGGAIEILSRGMLKTGPNEKPENTPSYNFSGPVNTIAQGHPVPVGYGKLIVGGATISASMSTSSLKSGYVNQEITYYKDIWARDNISNYMGGETPPPNYYSSQILQHYPPAYENDYVESWTIRFFYKETQLVLRTV